MRGTFGYRGTPTQLDKKQFRHRTQLRIRNYEVDWQGIVHNANYLLYFEVGRVEYLKGIGVAIDLNTIKNNTKVVLVRNEIDYESPSYFDELLDVYTRVSYIKNSSFAFEGFMETSGGGRLIARNLAIHVWLDPISGSPVTVAEDFRRKVRDFEGEHVSILDPA